MNWAESPTHVNVQCKRCMDTIHGSDCTVRGDDYHAACLAKEMEAVEKALDAAGLSDEFMREEEGRRLTAAERVEIVGAYGGPHNPEDG